MKKIASVIMAPIVATSMTACAGNDPCQEASVDIRSDQQNVAFIKGGSSGGGGGASAGGARGGGSSGGSSGGSKSSGSSSKPSSSSSKPSSGPSGSYTKANGYYTPVVVGGATGWYDDQGGWNECDTDKKKTKRK